MTRADSNYTQSQLSAQQSQQPAAISSNQTHDLHVHSSISAVKQNPRTTKKTVKLSRRRLPERDGRGRFIAKTSALHTGTNTPGTDSDFQLLSDQELQSPQDVASTRPLPPSPRPNSPQSPTSADFVPITQAFQSLLQQILLHVPRSQPIGSLHTQPQPARHNRKAMTEVKPFHGKDSTTENPQDFIKAFNHAMRECTTITTEYEKIEALVDYMVGGSAAEEWYNGLSTECQLSWDK